MNTYRALKNSWNHNWLTFATTFMDSFDYECILYYLNSGEYPSDCNKAEKRELLRKASDSATLKENMKTIQCRDWLNSQTNYTESQDAYNSKLIFSSLIILRRIISQIPKRSLRKTLDGKKRNGLRFWKKYIFEKVWKCFKKYLKHFFKNNNPIKTKFFQSIWSII